jgi:hypothetical protein
MRTGAMPQAVSTKSPWKGTCVVVGTTSRKGPGGGPCHCAMACTPVMLGGGPSLQCGRGLKPKGNPTPILFCRYHLNVFFLVVEGDTPKGGRAVDRCRGPWLFLLASWDYKLEMQG